MNIPENPIEQPNTHKSSFQNTVNTPPEKSHLKPTPKLEGLEGWLILPMLGLVVSIVYLPVTFFNTFSEVFEYWDVLTDPASSSYIPLLRETIYFELLGNAILYGTVLFLCFLFFNKKKLTVNVMIFFQVYSLILVVIDLLLANQLLSMSMEAEDVKDVIHSLVACAIWLPYFLISKRVKQTFIH